MPAMAAYPILDGNQLSNRSITVDIAIVLKVSSGNTLSYSIDHKLTAQLLYWLWHHKV